MLTMMMSIAHRITGAALYLGTLLLAWYLVAAASGPHAFAIAAGALSSWLGLVVLFGFTWALFQHLHGWHPSLRVGCRLRHGSSGARVRLAQIDARPAASS